MIAIIIVSYKSDSLTISYIRHLSKFINSEDKIIVVNNGSTLQSSTTIAHAVNGAVINNITESAKASDVYIIRSINNLGFAGGNNLGAEFARLHFQPKFLLFSNNDIKIQDVDTIQQLAFKLMENQDIGIIGPRVIGVKGELLSPEPYISFWSRYVIKSVGYHFISKQKLIKKLRLDYRENRKEGYVDKVMGSFFLVNADYFFECGMMDTKTFLYYEEFILTERMKKIGKNVYYLPSVSVLHEHGKTIKKFNSYLRMEKYNLQSGIYFYRNYKKTNWLTIIIGSCIYRMFNYYIALKNKQ